MSKSEEILVDLVDDPSFIRWIKGEDGSAEWDKWVEEDPVHQEVRKKAIKLYNLPYEEISGNDKQRELKHLQARISRDKSSLTSPYHPDVHRRPKREYILAVAAAISLLVTVVSVAMLYSDQQKPEEVSAKPLFSTIEVDYGEKGALKISDGSTIKLNANSSLRYSPEQFNSSQVEVWLEGEAYFSIVKNPEGRKRSFIVHTSDGDIQILGTRFNVNTRSERTDVVLEEGSIEVLLNNPGKGVTGQFRLEPGQLASFSSNKADVRVQKVDTSIYTAWLNGKLMFREAPLKNIIEKIEQTYGVNAKVADKVLLDKKVSGTLRNPDLETLLKGLEEIFSIEIRKVAGDSLLIKAL